MLVLKAKLIKNYTNYSGKGRASRIQQRDLVHFFIPGLGSYLGGVFGLC